jgi:hypothetical protein
VSKNCFVYKFKIFLDWSRKLLQETTAEQILGQIIDKLTKIISNSPPKQKSAGPQDPDDEDEEDDIINDILEGLKEALQSLQVPGNNLHFSPCFSR